MSEEHDGGVWVDVDAVMERAPKRPLACGGLFVEMLRECDYSGAGFEFSLEDVRAMTKDAEDLEYALAAFDALVEAGLFVCTSVAGRWTFAGLGELWVPES